MTIGEANAVNVLLRSLTNEDGTSWEDMELAGRKLADSAHKALMAGHDAESFSRALGKGQGLRRSQKVKGVRA